MKDMDIKDFIKKNNIAVLAEADNVTKMFNIFKCSLNMQSNDLFEQIILNSTTEVLIDFVSEQMLPRILEQGSNKCVISRINENKVVCVFYNSDMSAVDNYFYAKELNDKIIGLFTK